MPQRKFNPWLAMAFAGGLAYPLLVYFGFNKVPHVALVALAVALIGLRLIGLRKTISLKTAIAAFATIAIAAAILSLLHGELAVKAYPIAISLGIASLFGYSLIYPPSAVERMARLHEPDLPPKGVIYTRRVTIIWVMFLLANASVSAATAMWGTLEQWTWWNGFISYLLMGTLFIGEYIVRQWVRR